MYDLITQQLQKCCRGNRMEIGIIMHSWRWRPGAAECALRGGHFTLSQTCLGKITSQKTGVEYWRALALMSLSIKGMSWRSEGGWRGKKKNTMSAKELEWCFSEKLMDFKKLSLRSGTTTNNYQMKVILSATMHKWWEHVIYRLHYLLVTILKRPVQ